MPEKQARPHARLPGIPDFPGKQIRHRVLPTRKDDLSFQICGHLRDRGIHLSVAWVDECE